MPHVFSMNEDNIYNEDVAVAILIDESETKLVISNTDTTFRYKVSRSEMKKLYKFLQENQELLVKPEAEEETIIPVTYASIKNTVGWARFCEVTGGNRFAINQYGDFDMSHIFYITKTQFKQLW